MSNDAQTATTDNHFGGCPKCGANTGMIHVGRHEWCYCTDHKLAWYVGSNLSSAWRDQTDADLQDNRQFLESLEVVDSAPPVQANT